MKTALLLFLSGLLSAYASDGSTFFREDFNTLDQWESITFPKIPAHTRYDIITPESNGVLRAHSESSASAIVRKQPFEVSLYPRLRWRWKVDRILEKGDATRKASDDYAIRVYVMFIYEPEHASRGKRLKYALAKKLMGEYPPDSTLNYFWANRAHSKRILTNPYAKEAKMIVLRTGADLAGQWLEESVNIVEDYRKAFGTEPPAQAIVAIMSDTDNTGESTTAYVDWVEVSR